MSVIALCFVVLPRLVCLLLVYLTPRARMQSFAAEDVIKREAVGLRHACAVLRRGQGGAGCRDNAARRSC